MAQVTDKLAAKCFEESLRGALMAAHAAAGMANGPSVRLVRAAEGLLRTALAVHLGGGLAGPPRAEEAAVKEKGEVSSVVRGAGKSKSARRRRRRHAAAVEAAGKAADEAPAAGQAEQVITSAGGGGETSLGPRWEAVDAVHGPPFGAECGQSSAAAAAGGGGGPQSLEELWRVATAAGPQAERLMGGCSS